MILIFRFPFPNFRRTRKLDTVFPSMIAEENIAYSSYMKTERSYFSKENFCANNKSLRKKHLLKKILCFPSQTHSYLIQFITSFHQYGVVNFLGLPINSFITLIYVSNTQRWIPERLRIELTIPPISN